MSDAKKAEPDEELLEFLGGIDEINEGNEPGQDGDFSDFLANADIDRIAADQKPKPPVKSDPQPKSEAGK